MGWFQRKKTIKEPLHEIFSPIKGISSELSTLKDDFFSQGMLGDGIIVRTDINSGKLIYYAPVDGVLESVHPVGNTYGIRTTKGVPVLLHIGLDTVILDGQGFTRKVSQGLKVNAGDALVEVDIDYLNSKNASHEAIVVITNGMKITNKKFGNVDTKDIIFNVK